MVELTLLELGRCASRYDTQMAHAMLRAVAVAKVRGSIWWDIA